MHKNVHIRILCSLREEKPFYNLSQSHVEPGSGHPGKNTHYQAQGPLLAHRGQASQVFVKLGCTGLFHSISQLLYVLSKKKKKKKFLRQSRCQNCEFTSYRQQVTVITLVTKKEVTGIKTTLLPTKKCCSASPVKSVKSKCSQHLLWNK